MAARAPAQAQAPASPGPDAAALRRQTNLRAVQRADPALAEILDTANYTVVYLYGDDRWIKQKQEGSMFVVRRNKSPEYALFLLNRAAIKNVTIPLIPGEMKAKVIDASMLQVSRRGDKVPHGIWFADPTDVQRFADTILKVCGPPSAKPAAQAPTPASAPSVPPPITGASEDGFSRLFSGLTTVSGNNPHSQSASPLPSGPAPAPAAPPAPQPVQQPYAPASGQFPPGQFQLPGLPIPGLNAPLPGPPPPGFPPGGAGFPPGPPQGFPSAAGPYPPSPQRIPPPFHHPYTPPPPVRHSATPPAASSEPPLKAPPPAPLPAQSYAPGQTVDDLLSSILGVPGGAGAPAPSAPAPASAPAPTASTSAPPPTTGPQGPVPAQAARRASRVAAQPSAEPAPQQQSQSPSKPDVALLRDAVVTPFSNGARSTAPLGRQDLADVLVRLLQTDPRFVDDVWRTYLARIGAPQPPPHV